MGIDTAAEISYFESKAVNDLMRAHRDQLGTALFAMVMFGELVTRGDTLDIDVLEVIDGWNGPTMSEFRSSKSLSLRGSLRLYAISTEAFKAPHEVGDPYRRDQVLQLLRYVRRGYEVVLEPRFGLVAEVLRSSDALNLNLKPTQSGDPLILKPTGAEPNGQ